MLLRWYGLFYFKLSRLGGVQLVKNRGNNIIILNKTTALEISSTIDLLPFLSLSEVVWMPL
jgi:hypothetical protein